ncbi:hypothetical protein [Fluviispira vulneris]|uniref:hypothetical protein n=1 Tax=Fluviispira vulneris TaxID=2763012 RepID=UPI001648E6D1|nr:hypothetical protein [Fluviispira vulneris]
MKYYVEYFNGCNSEIKEIEADKYIFKNKFLDFRLGKSSVFLVAADAVVAIEVGEKAKVPAKVKNESIIRKLNLRNNRGIN